MKKKIKILESIRQGSFGGGETYLYNLVSGLDKERFEPVVLSFTEGAMVDNLRKDGVKTFVIHTLRPFDVSKFGQVKKLIVDEGVDLLRAHGTRACTNTLIPAALRKIKRIYTVHGWSFHTGNNKLVTQSRILSEKFLTSKSDVTICGSKGDIRQGEKNCSGGNYKLVYNSIDTNKYDPNLEIKDIRNEFGFGDNEFIISSIARLTFQKDPLTFIKAIPLVCDKIKNAKFLMVGDGELKDDILSLTNELNVTDKIVFSPFRSDIKELLKLTDVFVLPSLWEVVPLGLLEAMSMEKACIATDIDGTNEAIKDNVNGLCMEPHSYEQLSAKIIMLAEDEVLRKRLGENARKTVKEKFDLKELVRKNELIYEELYNGQDSCQKFVDKKL